ncbi:MAG: hypothetical protein ACLQAT_25570 [Candidatus Binataceae bacterium]
MSEHSVEIGRRASVYQRLKAEFLSVLPAVVFFFLAFNLINITHALFFHKQQIAIYSELNLLIGAAIAGKVLPLVDLLPFLNVFQGKPLIYATLWKTSIYSLGGVLFRYGERLAPFIFEYKELGVAIRQWILREDWYRFWGVQLWVFVILFVYVAAKETIEEIGGARMRRLFFGF